MYKIFFAYILSLTLLSTVAIPTYFSIVEEICESSLIIDIEDTEGNEKSEKNELKIIGFPIEYSSLYIRFSKEKNNIYQSNQYDSVYKKLESPPPENA